MDVCFQNLHMLSNYLAKSHGNLMRKLFLLLLFSCSCYISACCDRAIFSPHNILNTHESLKYWFKTLI